MRNTDRSRSNAEGRPEDHAESPVRDAPSPIRDLIRQLPSLLNAITHLIDEFRRK